MARIVTTRSSASDTDTIRLLAIPKPWLVATSSSATADNPIRLRAPPSGYSKSKLRPLTQFALGVASESARLLELVLGLVSGNGFGLAGRLMGSA